MLLAVEEAGKKPAACVCVFDISATQDKLPDKTTRKTYKADRKEKKKNLRNVALRGCIRASVLICTHDQSKSQTEQNNDGCKKKKTSKREHQQHNKKATTKTRSSEDNETAFQNTTNKKWVSRRLRDYTTYNNNTSNKHPLMTALDLSGK